MDGEHRHLRTGRAQVDRQDDVSSAMAPFVGQTLSGRSDARSAAPFIGRPNGLDSLSNTAFRVVSLHLRCHTRVGCEGESTGGATGESTGPRQGLGRGDLVADRQVRRGRARVGIATTGAIVIALVVGELVASCGGGPADEGVRPLARGDGPASGATSSSSTPITTTRSGSGSVPSQPTTDPGGEPADEPGAPDRRPDVDDLLGRYDATLTRLAADPIGSTDPAGPVLTTWFGARRADVRPRRRHARRGVRTTPDRTTRWSAHRSTDPPTSTGCSRSCPPSTERSPSPGVAGPRNRHRRHDRSGDRRRRGPLARNRACRTRDRRRGHSSWCRSR